MWYINIDMPQLVVPQEQQSCSDYEVRHDFKSDIEGIISRPLTPENINTFADDALNDLVTVLNQAEAVYDRQPTIAQSTGKNTEEAVLSYFSVADAETLLDHISGTADDIRDMDNFIQKLPVTSKVIVPTDSGEPITPGNGGGVEHRREIPRLKTTLFILAKQFGIDIQDPRQLYIMQGSLTEDMVRKIPYTVIQVPGLARTILVNDEVGNATYIVKNDVAEKIGLSTDLEKIMGLTKTALDSTYVANGAGERLIYDRNSFVRDVAAALVESASPEATEAIHFLDPGQIAKPPEGYLSLRGIARSYDIGSYVLQKAVQDLTAKGVLPPGRQYMFRGRLTEGYSEDDQEQILEWLEERNLLNDEAGDSRTTTGIATTFELPRSQVRGAIKQLTKEGKLEVAQADAAKTLRRFDAAEQELIVQKVQERMEAVAQIPEEGAISLGALAKSLGLDFGTVRRRYERLKEEGGLDTLYEGHSERGSHAWLTGEMKDQLVHLLVADGILGEKPPEEYMSATELAQRFGVAELTVRRLVGSIAADTLGPLGEFRYGHVYYSPAQAQIIEGALDAAGLLLPELPSEYMTTNEMALANNLARTTVKKLVEKLGEDGLGEIRRYRSSGNVAEGLSPDQQRIFLDFARAEGYFSPPAPDGYMTITSVAKSLGVKNGTVKKALDRLGPEVLGTTTKYRSGYRVADFYSPSQTQLIVNVLGETPHTELL